MPGFGEQMRQISLRFVPGHPSRQVAVIRGKSLVINLPGQPKSIQETLEGLKDGQQVVAGIFAAVPYCVDLIGGPYLETNDEVCKASGRSRRSGRSSRLAPSPPEAGMGRNDPPPAGVHERRPTRRLGVTPGTPAGARAACGLHDPASPPAGSACPPRNLPWSSRRAARRIRPAAARRASRSPATGARSGAPARGVVDQALHRLRQRVVVLGDAVGGEAHLGRHFLAPGAVLGLDDARGDARGGALGHRLVTTALLPIFALSPTVKPPSTLAPALTTTLRPSVGWRLVPLYSEVPPSVTPW